MPYTAQSLADAIRALMLIEPTTKASLDAWYDEARDVQDELARSPDLPISDGDWEGLMHYLIDSDIRVKDPEYSKLQLAGVRGILAKLDASQST